MEKIFAAIGALCFIALGIAAVIVYDVFAFSYVADIFWTWFALPNFSGLPDFTQHQFMAFFIIKSCLMYRSGSSDSIKDEYKKDNTTGKLIVALGAPWIILACGWIVKFFFFS